MERALTRARVSLTQEASLKDVDVIRQQIRRIKGGNDEDIPMVVVGTKMDLVRCRLNGGHVVSAHR